MTHLSEYTNFRIPWFVWIVRGCQLLDLESVTTLPRQLVFLSRVFETGHVCLPEQVL